MKSKIQFLKEELIVILAIAFLVPIIGIAILNVTSNSNYGTKNDSLGETTQIGNTIKNNQIKVPTGSGLTLYMETEIEKAKYKDDVEWELHKIEEHFKEKNTLYINSATQLKAFSQYTQTHTCEGKEIILLNDIDLSWGNWTPIGNIHYPFKGTFDGQGYRIENIQYSITADSEHVGLFGVIWGNGCVKSVGIKNPVVAITDKINQTCYFGTIAGVNYGRIDSVDFQPKSGNCIFCQMESVTNLHSGVYVGYWKSEDYELDIKQNSNVISHNYRLAWDCSLIEDHHGLIGTRATEGIELMKEYKIGFMEYEYGKADSTKTFEIGNKYYLGAVNVGLYDTSYYGSFNWFFKEDGKIYNVSPDRLITFEVRVKGELQSSKDSDTNTSAELKNGWNGLEKEERTKIMSNYVPFVYANFEAKDDTHPVTLKPNHIYFYEAWNETVIEYELDRKDWGGTFDNIHIDFTKNLNGENITIEDLSKNIRVNDEGKISYRVSYKGTLQTPKVEYDMNKPTLQTNAYAYVTDAERDGVYGEGQEIVIEVSTSEPVQATEAPKFDVSFSDSGVGKNSPVLIDSIIDEDGCTTWSYSYIIKDGDNGNLRVTYKSAELKDIAGNSKVYSNAPTEQSLYVRADTIAPTVEKITHTTPRERKI